MNIKKLIRDLLVIVIFCGAIYGITRAVNSYGNSAPVSAVDDEYSQDRQYASLAISEKRWQDAIIHFQVMLEKDPYDGHAWYWVGTSHNNLVYHCRRNLEKAKMLGRDEERLQMYRDLIAEHSIQAIPALERAAQFARFRNLANIQLAGLHARAGRSDESIAILETMFGDGYISNRGLLRNADLRSLREDPDFQDLVERESAVRIQEARGQSRRIGPGM